jgi:anaerobic selenocysteine-containing dehydrogenase
MMYDPETDHYVPTRWKDAFELIGSTLRGLDDPGRASFYTSGRLGNEATFLYQLMARELGTNNLPDCSNMCHEASGRALQASMGTGKGTVDLKDWESAGALFILGVNAASNAPRMFTALAEAHHRGAQIVHINPLVEAAATRTIVPHDFLDMALFKTTRTSTLNLQPRIGGDMALLRGMAKAVLEESKALDQEFIDRHTSGFDEYRALCEETPWAELERQSGISRTDILKAARIYNDADRSIFNWCLGLTHQQARCRHRAGDRQSASAARQPGTGGGGPLPRARAQQRPGQPDLRHRPPAHCGVPGPARRGLPDRSAP